MCLESYYFTNRGGRAENEDSAALSENELGGIYVVADGLGGHKHGEMASRCVVNTIVDSWKGIMARQSMERRMADCIAMANSEVLRLQEENRSNMKSTVVALGIEGKQAVYANTGDSRIYFIRGGKIHAISEDHSVAYKKFKAGEISRAQIAVDEDQSSLLKALGNERRWEPDVHLSDVKPGDAFMLCSDGIWEYLIDEEILADSLKTDDARHWAELMLVRVLGRISLGNDNMTLLTVKVK